MQHICHASCERSEQGGIQVFHIEFLDAYPSMFLAGCHLAHYVRGWHDIHSLLQTLSNVHAVEHELMKCLANLMWQAQQTGTMPTEAEYLETLTRGL